MLMIGHLAEASSILFDGFRVGDVAPATQNPEFIQACGACLPKGYRIAHVRLDSSSYQADIVNDCQDAGKTFAIGGRLDATTQRATAATPKPTGRRIPIAPLLRRCTA